MNKYCSKCGAPMQEGQKFCTNCGAPAAQIPAQTLDKCPICKKKLPFGAVNCPKCKTKLDSVSVQPQIQNTPQQNAAVPFTPVMPAAQPKKEIEPKTKKAVAAAVVAAAVICIIAVVFSVFVSPALKYSKAQKLYGSKSYSQACDIMEDLAEKDYKNAKDLLPEYKYARAQKALDDKNFDEAKEYFSQIITYKDSKDKLTEVDYQIANKYFEDKEYEKAYKIYYELGEYKDCYKKTDDCCLKLAEQEYANKNYEKALDYYCRIYDYSIDTELFKECEYQLGLQSYKNGDFKNAALYFETVESYKDSKKYMLDSMYQYVHKNKNNTDYSTYYYLKTLKSNNYKDSAKIYSSLYKWHIKVTAINHSREDETNFNGKFYANDSLIFHFVLEGGTPDSDGTVIKIKTILPGGRKDSLTMMDGERCARGFSGWYGWEDKVFYDSGNSGKATVKFYDSSGNKIGEQSVYLN